ncbi:MAG: tetratricopeptide repeat protein [Acidobacteriota bacterium]|nr:tetratricopeptide repeat protein [Acidobacteriota bacterium]
MLSRIEELERRVRQDPASIAFGALAEEYRRAGRLDEAIASCRAGLERHPSYLSARVTLGRALQEAGDPAGARSEYEYVLSLAPDNLAAIRGLAEMHDGPDDTEPAPVLTALEPPPLFASGAPDLPDLPAIEEIADVANLPDVFDAFDLPIATNSAVIAQIERLEIWLARMEEARDEQARLEDARPRAHNQA